MTNKQKLISAYLAIGILFALYGWQFGETGYRGFAYNLGRGLFWPTILFPFLGSVLGVIVLVMIIAVITFVL
ncbi:hypothetical protein [Burkholderia multivorans]|uniref:hypothetical protein n=1 Tax=Burkholderia multivorans TaxID=87883 RepID=UPI0006A62E94|nr:hypothetical protein [Burkholderia multivorans]KOE22445.1 hypothetical protein AI46_29960 [Burkholderia multivorans R-20526]MBU9652407.1 hypothetical protein [Burkholderia multivorans]MDN7437428.1 hypothetical protein [Burkholderia multivorans]MDN7941552.1 hypothetical protein [Burkholderia multivorans]MDN7953694.1 hypothetical protein [Burkholderia multivorans]